MTMIISFIPIKGKKSFVTEQPSPPLKRAMQSKALNNCRMLTRES
jgi:hypothetical protein